MKRGFTDKVVFFITISYFVVVFACLVLWYLNGSAPTDVLSDISGVFSAVFVSNVAKNGYENGVRIKKGANNNE